jgi:hypothetical protein
VPVQVVGRLRSSNHKLLRQRAHYLSKIFLIRQVALMTQHSERSMDGEDSEKPRGSVFGAIGGMVGVAGRKSGVFGSGRKMDQAAIQTSPSRMAQARPPPLSMGSSIPSNPARSLEGDVELRGGSSITSPVHGRSSPFTPTRVVDNPLSPRKKSPVSAAFLEVGTALHALVEPSSPGWKAKSPKAASPMAAAARHTRSLSGEMEATSKAEQSIAAKAGFRQVCCSTDVTWDTWPSRLEELNFLKYRWKEPATFFQRSLATTRPSMAALHMAQGSRRPGTPEHEGGAARELPEDHGLNGNLSVRREVPAGDTPAVDFGSASLPRPKSYVLRQSAPARERDMHRKRAGRLERERAAHIITRTVRMAVVIKRLGNLGLEQQSTGFMAMLSMSNRGSAEDSVQRGELKREKAAHVITRCMRTVVALGRMNRASGLLRKGSFLAAQMLLSSGKNRRGSSASAAEASLQAWALWEKDVDGNGQFDGNRGDGNDDFDEEGGAGSLFKDLEELDRTINKTIRQRRRSQTDGNAPSLSDGLSRARREPGDSPGLGRSVSADSVSGGAVPVIVSGEDLLEAWADRHTVPAAVYELRVCVVQADRLKPVGGGSASPYLLATCGADETSAEAAAALAGGGTVTPEQSQQTRPVKRTLAPLWGEVLTFKVLEPELANGSLRLQCSIFDGGLRGRSKKFLGQVTVPLIELIYQSVSGGGGGGGSPRKGGPTAPRVGALRGGSSGSSLPQGLERQLWLACAKAAIGNRYGIRPLAWQRSLCAYCNHLQRLHSFVITDFGRGGCCMMGTGKRDSSGRPGIPCARKTARCRWPRRPPRRFCERRCPTRVRVRTTSRSHRAAGPASRPPRPPRPQAHLGGWSSC